MISPAATPSPARRLLAALLACCVLAISALTVSPALHAWVHGGAPDPHASPHRHGHGDHHGRCSGHDGDATDATNDPADPHTCAVTLFAQGVEAPSAANSLQTFPVTPVATIRLTENDSPQAAPSLRLPPACGPPSRELDRA